MKGLVLGLSLEGIIMIFLPLKNRNQNSTNKFQSAESKNAVLKTYSADEESKQAAKEEGGAWERSYRYWDSMSRTQNCEGTWH